jgi:Domain of unknown function (DUF1818)
MARFVKSGKGWRVGWDDSPTQFQGLIGTEDWAVELTPAEFDDFCRLAQQLSETMGQMQTELMDEEAIACEAESDWVWLEAEGYPQAYSLRFILLSDRRVEGKWEAAAVAELLPAVQSLKVF